MTIAIVALVAGALIVAGGIIGLLTVRGKVSARLGRELRHRYLSWLLLVPLMVGPVLLGSFWGIVATCVLSLLCFGEFARATGLFRERLLCVTVVVCILHVYIAVLDRWFEFFLTTVPISICIIAAITVFEDRPATYIQRVATASFGFLFFGTCLGYLGYMMNLAEFRPFVLWLLLCVEMNDVFGFVIGKTLGHRKLLPATSPGKTIAGSLGALILTAALASGLGSVLLEGPLENPVLLLVLGLLIPFSAQLGDLMLSSVKRDLGVKDLGASLPGHGGVLDRFDSLLLAAPVVFSYCSALGAWEFDTARRILTRS